MVRSHLSACLEPLGDPSARVFEVFLIVLDGVQGKTLWEGESRARNHTHSQPVSQLVFSVELRNFKNRIKLLAKLKIKNSQPHHKTHFQPRCDICRLRET